MLLGSTYGNPCNREKIQMIDPMKSLPAGSRIILRALMGSTIHGTNVAQQDDRDEDP